MYGAKKKARRLNLVTIVSDKAVVLESKKKRKLVKKLAMMCAGGNVLLERGSIVTLDDYKKLKRKVLSHDF